MKTSEFIKTEKEKNHVALTSMKVNTRFQVEWHINAQLSQRLIKHYLNIKISLQALSIDLLGEIIKIYIEKTKITLLQCSLESRTSESIIPIR